MVSHKQDEIARVCRSQKYLHLETAIYDTMNHSPKSTNHSTHLSINQSIKQSINQSINQSKNESINQLINQSIN